MPENGSPNSDIVTIRIRVDESVRSTLPPLSQAKLKIEPDQSDQAKALARRAPEQRAFPIFFVIVGAIAVVHLLQMIKELVRQAYYGGVVIDTRSQPPTISSDPSIPANMIFVVDTKGKTTRYTNDKFSLDTLRLALKSLG
jgi:hypothetical protein